MATALRLLSQQEQLNFLLTNRIPRRALTRLCGWFSRVENRTLARAAIAVWRAFSDDLRLEEAVTTDFASVHACFTRRLKPGARPIDPDPAIVTSPCDAIVGECGAIEGTTVFQAKGFPYEIGDLVPAADVRRPFRDGRYVTLRLKSSMYHRFHAPTDCRVDEITYLSGDTWNVNPIALKRIERLYCRNERAVLSLSNLGVTGNLCLVPVAAILVASMAFVGVEEPLDLAYRGPHQLYPRTSFRKGDEMGHFRHGSTIILLASANFALCDGIGPGSTIRMGQALLRDTGFHAPTGEP